MKLGLVFGGKSPEHEVSIVSARNIYNAIDKAKFSVTLIGIAQDGKWFLETENNLQDQHCVIGKSGVQLAVLFGNEKNKIIRLDTSLFIDDVDVIFPITHGPNGEDGTLQGIFTQLDIPFVGPGVLGSAVAMDKDFTKRILRDAGIGIANGQVLFKHLQHEINYAEIQAAFGDLLFIKPCNMGSSVGVSKSTNEQEFFQAVKHAFQFDTKILVEQGIKGRELECAVYGNETPEVSTAGEIQMLQGFYDFENKYINDNAKITIPADNLSEAQLEKVRTTAKKAYQALGLEGMSRVDVFLTDDDEVIVNEPNTLPGFTSISMYPKLWENSGVAYSQLIENLIAFAMERHERNKQIQRVRVV